MDDDFKERLLGVAEDRLRSRRGFFQRFRHDLANDWRLSARLSLQRANGSASVTLLRQVDPIASERAETANMIAFVDEWASKQPAPPSVEPLPALVPIQRHAGRTVGAPGVLRHSMKSKGRDTLDPVIEMAQSLCDDPDDWAQVWAQMQVLAQEEKPPLLGLIPEGIKYTQVVPKPGIFTGIFTKNALGKRLKRRR